MTKPTDRSDLYMTASDLALEFGVTAVRISQLESKGVLPQSTRIGKGRMRVWPRADLEEIRRAFDARNTIPGRRVRNGSYDLL